MKTRKNVDYITLKMQILNVSRQTMKYCTQYNVKDYQNEIKRGRGSY